MKFITQSHISKYDYQVLGKYERKFYWNLLSTRLFNLNFMNKINDALDDSFMTFLGII